MSPLSSAGAAMSGQEGGEEVEEGEEEEEEVGRQRCGPPHPTSGRAARSRGRLRGDAEVWHQIEVCKCIPNSEPLKL